MTRIEEISQAARELTPEQVRARLDDLDQESRVLRAVLRAVIRSGREPGDKRPATEGGTK